MFGRLRNGLVIGRGSWANVSRAILNPGRSRAIRTNASSSMIITVPGRAMTLVLLANGQGLARPFSLAGGDVTGSPFARLFLSLFLR